MGRFCKISLKKTLLPAYRSMTKISSLPKYFKQGQHIRTMYNSSSIQFKKFMSMNTWGTCDFFFWPIKKFHLFSQHVVCKELVFLQTFQRQQLLICNFIWRIFFMVSYSIYVRFMSFGQSVACRNCCWMSNICYCYLF